MNKIITVIIFLTFTIGFSQDKTKAFVFDKDRKIIGEIKGVKGTNKQKKSVIIESIQEMEGDYYYIQYYTDQGDLMECPFYRENKTNQV